MYFKSVENYKYRMSFSYGKGNLEVLDKVNEEALKYFISKFDGVKDIEDEEIGFNIGDLDIGKIAKVKAFKNDEIDFVTHISRGYLVISFNKKFDDIFDPFKYITDLFEEFFTKVVFEKINKKDYKDLLDVRFFFHDETDRSYYKPIISVQIDDVVYALDFYQDVKRHELQRVWK